jgi:hypothetical protein
VSDNPGGRKAAAFRANGDAYEMWNLTMRVFHHVRAVGRDSIALIPMLVVFVMRPIVALIAELGVSQWL